MPSRSIEARAPDEPTAPLGYPPGDASVALVQLATFAGQGPERRSGELRFENGVQTPNRLLCALPSEARARFEPYLEKVRLTSRAVLFDAGEPLAHVYFPETAVVSLVSKLRDGGDVEVASVGSEGIVGLSFVLGERVSPARASCQIGGTATRMATAHLARLRKTSELHGVLLRYAHAFLTQLSQTAVCNRSHLVEERCARWLLTTHDRIGGPELPITHDLLAATLGVRRAGVTLAIRALQDAGLVRSGRGTIAIVDRSRLERVSCECYGVVRAGYERLGPRGT